MLHNDSVGPVKSGTNDNPRPVLYGFMLVESANYLVFDVVHLLSPVVVGYHAARAFSVSAIAA